MQLNCISQSQMPICKFFQKLFVVIALTNLQKSIHVRTLKAKLSRTKSIKFYKILKENLPIIMGYLRLQNFSWISEILKFSKNAKSFSSFIL